MRLFVTDVAWSMCLLVTIMSMSYAKTDKLIEIPFGMSTRVGPRNHEEDFPMESGNLL